MGALVRRLLKVAHVEEQLGDDAIKFAGAEKDRRVSAPSRVNLEFKGANQRG